MKNSVRDLLSLLDPRVQDETKIAPRPDVETTQEWQALMKVAAQFAAELPFLAAIERAPWRQSLPFETQEQFDSSFRRERMRLVLLEEALEESLECLNSAGVPALVVKGADLSRRFYPSPIFRPMGDIDLMVPREALIAAVRALRTLGYGKSEPLSKQSFRGALARPEGGSSIDLHFKLIVDDTPEHLKTLWGRSQIVNASGISQPFSVLSREDALVYVLRHAAVQHVLDSPLWLNDIHFIIAGKKGMPPLDWELVIDEIHSTKSVSAAFFVFNLIQLNWQTPIPLDVLEALAVRVGPVRRRALAHRADLESWFFEQGRSLKWVANSRYLLRDGIFEVAKYAAARFGRKFSERRARSANLDASPFADGF